MASGPAGTGWSYLATNLNAMFQPGNIGAFAATFKNKHGSDGNGKDPNTTPYKFGQFVDRHGGLLSGTALGQFLIDSGRRHWDDASLDLLEYTVKQSLTNATPKQITFTVQDDTTGKPKAWAVIRDAADPNPMHSLKTPSDIDAAGSYNVEINCPPPNPRRT
jgi:hypothetical protein